MQQQDWRARGVLTGGVRRRAAHTILGAALLATILVTVAGGPSAASGTCPTDWVAANLTARVPPAGHQMRGIAVAADDDVWAVGRTHPSAFGSDDLAPRAEHWNGTTWSATSVPATATSSSLADVAAPASNDVWAVGVQGNNSGTDKRALLEHWNGTTWSEVAVPSPTATAVLSSVSASSTSDVWTVGWTKPAADVQSLVLRWNGTAWSAVSDSAPVGTVLNAVHARTATDVWAVGYTYDPSIAPWKKPFAEHWDGTTWSIVATMGAVAAEQYLSGVTATASNDAWVIGRQAGAHAGPVAMHWDGTSFTEQTPTLPTGGGEAKLLAVAAAGASDVWAVGWSYGPSTSDVVPETVHWDGSAWTRFALAGSGGFPYDVTIGVGGERWALSTSELSAQVHRRCDTGAPVSTNTTTTTTSSTTTTSTSSTTTTSTTSTTTSTTTTMAPPSSGGGGGGGGGGSGGITAPIERDIPPPTSVGGDRPPLDIPTDRGQIRLDFGTVGGTFKTEVKVSDSPPASVQSSYEAVGATFEVKVTGTTSTGQVQVCLPIPSTSSAPTNQLHLLHLASSGLEDITSGRSGNQVCGVTGSFSPFLLAIPRIARLAGNDRVATSIAVSSAHFPSASTVVVASGANYADALAAGPLAARSAAPVLLSVGPTASSALLAEVGRLGASDVILVGGTAAVPTAVERSLAGVSKVRRVAGADRYATAAAVADAMSAPSGTSVWIANGSDPAVALAAAAAAGRGRGALLLTEAGTLPKATLAALQRMHPGKVVVAGDAKGITNAVLSSVKAVAGSVERVAGADAYATAVALAGPITSGTPAVYVTSASAWPDAVSASWVAGFDQAPLLLVERDKAPAATTGALRSMAPRRLFIIGGTAAVGSNVESAVRSFLG